MITKKFYWNWKKLPNGIRPFGFFIMLPPLKELEKFVDESLPVLPEKEKKERNSIEDIKRALIKKRIKRNETSIDAV